MTYINKIRELKFIKVRERQVNKFNRLLLKNNLEFRQQYAQSIGSNNRQAQVPISNSQVQESSNNNHANKWVVNSSSVPLTPAQESLLSKRPNFAIAPLSPPNVEFISAIESVCHRISDQDAQELRAETNCL